ncbi:tripartite tricarboxylate transporter TctB family protein [Pseudalkalibacillus sp. R45]|uniref:tripartite tricarboxylate transporter TctB family protein n=1 Tax=Pseudalkalibacillus sp. R45 TaxID=3457433 RepID=UPI003FCCF142
MTHELKNILFLLGIGSFALFYFLDVKNLPDPQEKNLVTMLIIGLAVLLTIEASRSIYKGIRKKNQEKMSTFKGWRLWIKNKQIILVFSLIGYVILVPIIGFFVTTLGFVLLMNLLLENRKWWEMTVLPFVLLLIVYTMFVWLLGVDLPQGYFF